MKADEIKGTCSTHVKMRNQYIILVGKSEGNRAFTKTSDISEDNIKIDLKDLGCEGADWIHLPLDGGLAAGSYKQVMNCWLPYKLRTPCEDEQLSAPQGIQWCMQLVGNECDYVLPKL
jgi:hypothetical protein